MTSSPPNESDRLAALARPRGRDTLPEHQFDDLVRAAALACGVPIALLSLIDADHRWLEAIVGLPDIAGSSREEAFCVHAILEEGVFEVPDTMADARFAENPLAIGSLGLRFCAGAPLHGKDGSRVGTLCVLDLEPGRLAPEQRAMLGHLSAAAVKLLEARRTVHDLTLGEARFRALSDSSPLGTFATDAAGACTYTNERWQAIFDTTCDDALGQCWSRRWVHPEDQEAFLAEWRRTVSLPSDFDREFRLRHDDGTVRHGRVVSRPVLSENGEVSGHVGSVEDIGERKQRDGALHGNDELLLSETGALAKVGGCELDLESDDISWSDEACRIHGLAPGRYPRLQEWIELFVPKGQAMLRDAIARIRSGGRFYDLELRLRQPPGREAWLRIVGQVKSREGHPVRLRAAVQDVTAEVQRRNAFESARRRLEVATESGQIGIWEWDMWSETIRWTPQMFALFGLPADLDDVSHELWLDQVHRDDRHAVLRALGDAIANADHWDTEYRIVWSDGSVRHLRASARIVRDAAGQPVQLLGVNWDVTSLQRLGDELASQHELLRVTLESIGDAVITTDVAGRVTWQNPVAERMTGWPSADAVGKPLGRVFHIVDENTGNSSADPVMACLQGNDVTGLAEHTLLVARDGTERSIEDTASLIRDRHGALLGAVLVFRDVTEQRRLSSEMSYRATHDALTGLVNRTEFETRLDRTLRRARGDRSDNALMCIDLDRFKLINDACGHSAGDLLLSRVSRLLADIVRGTDTLARLGGDEFGVILENCSSDQALRVAQEICDRMEAYRFTYDERRFNVGTSIGLAPLDGRWENTATAMQAADLSCYAAKEAGRNRVHVWFDTDRALLDRQGDMRWATRLERALDEDRFVLYLQRIEPLGSSRSGIHAEILLRLHESDESLILPNVFLPAAERFQLVTRIDRWVLGRVVEKLGRLPDVADVEVLCVNLSGRSIGDRMFHHDAIELLMAAGDDICHRLCLEVTETAAVTNLSDAALFIDRVRALGVRVALDDFGAGASSFGYLRTLKVDVLKIDGQFITNLLDDPLSEVTVGSFVDVARVMRLKTVAEFVDSPRTLTRVRELGIDYAQGFLLHRPEPFGDRISRPGTLPAGTGT